MILRLKRTPGIYLVGFMGSGKTTIGKSLAWEIGWAFFDVDAEIETEQGRTIAEIFDTAGEAEFRRLETEALRRHVRAVENGRPSVIALGGGTFVQPANFDLLTDNGITVWLDCPFELVRARIEASPNRPLARDAERLARLYEERRAAYGRSDYRIEITGDDSKEVVASILKLPIF